MDHSKTIVSKYKGVTDIVGKPVKVLDELYKIRDGAYSSEVVKCRDIFIEKGKEAYNNEKKKLDAPTFSGFFKKSRAEENIVYHTGIIIIDYDNLSIEELKTIKEQMLNCEYVLSCFISPSGFGLKVLVHTAANQETHEFYYSSVVDYLDNITSRSVDLSGKDCSRLCFVSFDPDIQINTDCSIYEIDCDDYLLTLAQKKATNTISKSDKILLAQKAHRYLLYDPVERNAPLNRRTMKQIIQYLTKENFSITPDYNSWIRVAFAIANSFTYDIGKGYYIQLCRLDGKLHDEEKSTSLLDHCYLHRRVDSKNAVVKFPTIVYLAQKKGFKIRSSTK